jgi:hypothetical protein
MVSFRQSSTSSGGSRVLFGAFVPIRVSTVVPRPRTYARSLADGKVSAARLRRLELGSNTQRRTLGANTYQRQHIT